MKTKLTPIAAATAVVLAGALAPAFAQTAAAPSAAASAAKSDVQTVEVRGIRASLQQSLNQKRNAESHVEVITAEDVGKLPDKNVADSLARVPGLNISSAGATEGGFDESDRVSMRGTNPSLTQTLVNGHNVASGDWFALDQTGTGNVGRSVSYTLLPSEVVSSVVVHKSSEASYVEGGVVGSVDIITRRPLDFSKPFTMMGSLGAVYADLPAKTDPQANLLGSWKNEAGTFGVLAQAFFEKRHLRRDGSETLGYEQIAPGSKVAALVGYACDRPWREARTQHLASLAVVRRHAFVNTHWSTPGAELLVPKGALGTAYNADPSQFVYDFKRCPTDLRPRLAKKVAAVPRDVFDYVWVFGFPPARLPAYPGLRPLYADGASVLYAVEGKKGRP